MRICAALFGYLIILIALMNPHIRENTYLERNESSKLISYFPRENHPMILTLHLDFIPTTIILKFERFSIECRKTRTKRFTKANRRKEKNAKSVGITSGQAVFGFSI